MRSYVSQLTIELDDITTVGRLWPIRQSESKFKLCTKDYDPVHQIYQDDEDNTYRRGQLIYGRPVKGQYKLDPVGDIEEIKDARTSTLEKNLLVLSAHDANRVNEYLYPADTQGYVFQPVRLNSSGHVVPDKLNEIRHNIINVLLRDTNVVLLGKCNMQNHEGLFRLGLYRGMITVQKQLYPEDLNDFDFETPISNPKLAEKAQELAKELVRDFEPEAYENEIKRRIEMIATGNYQIKPADPVLDLIKAMEEFMS